MILSLFHSINDYRLFIGKFDSFLNSIPFIRTISKYFLYWDTRVRDKKEFVKVGNLVIYLYLYT